MNFRHALFALLSLCMLSACDSTASLMELRQASTPTNAYDAALATGYRDFADQKLKAYAWWDSKYFADKGLLAANGHTMLPEEPERWDIAETILPEFQDARKKLLALWETSRKSQPAETAAAVVAYDRWLVLAEAGWDTPKIEDARDNFFAALGKLTPPVAEKAEEPAAAKDEAKTTEPAAPPAPPAPPVETTSTIIYFPFNSAALDDKAKKALAHLVEYIKSAGNVGVTINGHADRSGVEGYNMVLSKKRAETVGKALEAGGIPEKSLHYYAFGESDAKVPTDDGKREPMNRRVEIYIE